jgi:ribonucleoside-diphosphate reductase beta chain
MASRLPDLDALLAISARGAWDPDAVDLRADRERWDALPDDVRDRLRGLLAGFVVGEEAVAEHLVPFQDATASPGLRACLAAQVVEEERHAYACVRAWRAMTTDGDGVVPDPADDAPSALVGLFRDRLPAVAAAAGEDLTGAVALYHGLLEGVVFLAGQRTVRALAEEWALPGLLETFARIERDERWHVALGARVLVDAVDGGSVAARLTTEAEEAAASWGPLVDDEVRRATADGVTRRLRAVGLVGRPASRIGLSVGA